MSCWEIAQKQIEECRRCERENVQYLVVPKKKRHPSFLPLQPTRLLFVSVAPPWGGSYFWDDTQPDGLRKGLFEALEKAGQRISTLSQFRKQGFFLVPAVKCPSCKNGNDHKPTIKAVKNCASFLHEECQILFPERILALGKSPMQSASRAFGLKIPPKVKECRKETWWVSLGDREIPLMGTYFPGNKRHKGGEDIVADIEKILSL